MRTVAFTQARSHFKQMIDAAAKGEVVQITRNGKAVAELRPTLEAEQEYWQSRQPLRIGKRGLGKALYEEDRKSGR